MTSAILLSATLLLAGSDTVQPQPVMIEYPAAEQAVKQAMKAQADSVPVVPTATASPSASKSIVLSRQQCIDIALQDNPTIKVADMEIQRMDLSKLETRAALFPSVDFSGAYQRSLALQTISMNMGGQTQSIKMGSDNTWNFGFSATVPLFAPTLWKSLKISDTQILASYETARASRLNLVDQVNQAYYALMLAKASYEVLQANYELAKYNADIYSKQYSFGTATEYDVLRSQVAVTNLEPELLEAQIAIDRCRLQLRVLMGIADDIVIDPDVTLKDMERDMYDYVARIARSLAGNTDLRSLDIQAEMADRTVELRKWAFLPTLGASLNINWNALSNGNALKNQQFHPYSVLGFQLSIPLFQGGSHYYGLKQAEVQSKEIRLQRENLVNALNMQVDLAVENINKEVRQISSSAEGVRQAEKASSIMQKSVEIGAGSFLTLRDSEVAEVSAKLTYYQAIYNYLISTSALDLLLGREEELRNIGYSFPINQPKK